MIKKTFERVDEELFIEKLDNGITIYMYPTKKTKKPIAVPAVLVTISSN